MHAPTALTAKSTTEAPIPGVDARRLLVVHNPVAGWRRLGRFQRTIEALRAQGCAVEVRQTGGPGDAFRLARDAHDVDVVVVAGGDGTINEALNGLADNQLSGLSLAIIPMGTANVLAAELGLPIEDPEALAKVIAHGPSLQVHLGAANGRRFVQMAGAGFDAHVVATVSTRIKRLFGKGAYVLAALLVAARFRHPRYQVEIDGTVYEAGQVVVCNGHFYAGRFVLAPDARPWTPRLDVCLFERSGPLQPLRYGLAMLLGRLPKLPDVRVVSGRSLRIDGPQDDPVQGDGDLLSHLPIQVELLENAASFIVPANLPGE